MTLQVNGYRVEGTLTAGRRGPILHAVRLLDGLAVVVHVLDADLDPARFLGESGGLSALPEDPHIVPVLDAGVAGDGRPYLVTPRAERSLADRLASGPLALSEVTEAGLGAAAGVTALHEADVLHGNLTPGNLLVLPNGLVAVTGMALPVLAETETDWSYRAPEILQGGEWTVAADVYGLGATLWALLAGHSPYLSSKGLLVRLQRAPAPELPAGVAEPVRAVLRRAMAADPAERYPTVAEFADALCTAASTPAPAPAAAPLPVRRARGRVADVPLDTSVGMEAAGTSGRESSGGERLFGSDYLLYEQLGQGATGRVYRGRRRTDGQPVAIKILHREHADDPTVVMRFIREQRLARIAHPHLVRVHKLEAVDDLLGIVMDLIEGDNLRAALGGGRFEPDDAYAVLAQVASALAAVHAADIVHRDLKPENIMIARGGAEGGAPRAWLTDFGIARMAAGPAITRFGDVLGTFEYSAPELFEKADPSPASDVYALGVVAYELLSGTRPFKAETPAGLGRAHRDDEPPPPEGTADDAWRIVSSCLAKDPAARPGAERAATAFAALVVPDEPAILRTLIPATPPLTRSTPAVPAAGDPDDQAGAVSAPGKPTVRRGRRLVLTLAVLATALVGLTAGFLTDSHSNRRSPSSSPTPAPKHPDDSGDAGTMLVRVGFKVASTRPGQVKVTLTGNAPPRNLIGYYLDFGDGQSWTHFEPPYTFHMPRDQTCVRVAGLVAKTGKNKRSTAPSPRRECLIANGRDARTSRP